MREKQRKNKRKNGKKSGNSSGIKTRQRRQVAVATHTQGTLKRIQAGRQEGRSRSRSRKRSSRRSGDMLMLSTHGFGLGHETKRKRKGATRWWLDEVETPANMPGAHSNHESVLCMWINFSTIPSTSSSSWCMQTICRSLVEPTTNCFPTTYKHALLIKGQGSIAGWGLFEVP